MQIHTFIRQIGLDIALTNVEATLKQSEIISYQRWNDIAQRWKMVTLTLHKVDLTLFKRWTPTMYQCCATLKIRFRILFHFPPRINVIWTVIYNVAKTLIRRWNVGRVVSMKTLILRIILPASLLTK